jgi:hypothetical protein
MIQISYVSSSAQPMHTTDLVDLLQQCLKNNAAEGITGMLLYGNDTFLQTLEGEAGVIDALYDKILHDPRHTQIRCLYRKPIEQRRYAEWSMGFKHVSDESLHNLEGLKNFGQQDFTYDYLTEHEGVADNLMSHYAYWDPLVRAIDERDQKIRHMEKNLARAHGQVDVASLVLENLLQAEGEESLGENQGRLCRLALETLRKG